MVSISGYSSAQIGCASIGHIIASPSSHIGLIIVLYLLLLSMDFYSGLSSAALSEFIRQICAFSRFASIGVYRGG